MDTVINIEGAALPLLTPPEVGTDSINFKDFRASWLVVRDEACALIGINPFFLKCRIRTAPVVLVRHFVAYCIHRQTKLSIAGIGRLFERDHTSIMHGLNKMRELEKQLGGFAQLQAHVIRTWKETR